MKFPAVPTPRPGRLLLVLLLLLATALRAQATFQYQDPAITAVAGRTLQPDPPVPDRPGSYAVSPALPPGLVLDPGTGVLSGRPGSAAPATAYAVTRTEPHGGPRVAHLTITVLPPPFFTYQTTFLRLTKGTALAGDAPRQPLGGTPTGFAVSPPLPAGLDLAPDTGALTGTPTVLAPPARYTVTATYGAAGSSRAHLFIEVVDAPPQVAYATPFTFYVGQSVDVLPASTGGAVVSYALVPGSVPPQPLPAGLSFVPATGEITGTPTPTATALLFTVRAWNTGGAQNVPLSITVLPMPAIPLAISVEPTDARAGLGQTATFTVTATGGAGTYAYQWYRDGSPVGISAPAYTTPPVTAADNKAQFTVTVTDSASGQATSTAATLTVGGIWLPTGAMAYQRELHTATLLNTGKVLIVGGWGLLPGGGGGGGFGGGPPVAEPLNSAELYDPQTGTFTPTGSMAFSRLGHVAALLGDGRVLIAGGEGYAGSAPAAVSTLASAEIYDPSTGTFSVTGTMARPRVYATATPFTAPDASIQVLVAGGDPFVFPSEVFDPATGTFSNTSNTLAVARSHATATALPSGEVLIAGGGQAEFPLPSLEEYDPGSNAFTLLGATLTVGRTHHTATLIPAQAEVLFAGGEPTGSLDLYDLGTGTDSSPAGVLLATPVSDLTASLLQTGEVFLVGGTGTANGTSTTATALFDPAAATLTAGAPLPADPRSDHTATTLGNGDVLIVGGATLSGGTTGTILASAFLYQP